MPPVGIPDESLAAAGIFGCLHPEPLLVFSVLVGELSWMYYPGPVLSSPDMVSTSLVPFQLVVEGPVAAILNYKMALTLKLYIYI